MVLPVMKPAKKPKRPRVEISVPLQKMKGWRGVYDAGSRTAKTAEEIGWQILGGFVLSGLCLDGRYVADILGSLRMPGVIGGLHPRPNSCAIAKKFAKPDRYGRVKPTAVRFNFGGHGAWH
jgi:hypothetical protein